MVSKWYGPGETNTPTLTRVAAPLGDRYSVCEPISLCRM